MSRVQAFATLAWAVLVVPSVLWWAQSVRWLVLMSVWANFASHFGNWLTERAAVKAAEHREEG